MTPTARRSLPDDALVLIPSTPESARAELESAEALGRILGVEVDPSWPPDLYDRPAVEWNLRLLEADPESAGWGTWYFGVRRRGMPVLLIGAGGYKGKPSEAGEVEIGYSVVPAHQRRGYGAAAAGRLVAHALDDAEVKCVLAETLPELIASIRVLERNGFVLKGKGSEPGVIRYELLRE
jgi:[ribosomal protein S5]-alanine N-acetyltransferase